LIKVKSYDSLFSFLKNALSQAWDYYVMQYNSLVVEFAEEPVHDFRVGIRRVTSLLMLIEELDHFHYSKLIKKQLKFQIKSFNKLRDTQVQIINIKNMLDKYPDLSYFVGFLEQKEKDLIIEAKETVSKIDLDEIYGFLILLKIELTNKFLKNKFNVQTLFDSAHLSFLEVVKCKNMVEPENPSTIHKVRLNFKKFRYIMEILREHFGYDKDYFITMKKFQTTMGEIQDNLVLLPIIQEFAEKQQVIPNSQFSTAIEEILSQRQLLIKRFISNSGILLTLWNNKVL